MAQSVKVRHFTEGRILPLIIKFTVPLMLTGMLQLLFNTADTMMVGRWGGDTPAESEAALAAGLLRIRIYLSGLFLCGLMEMGGGVLRGLGRSTTAPSHYIFAALAWRRDVREHRKTATQKEVEECSV